MTDNLRNVVNIEENEGPPLSFHGQVQAQKGDGPLRMHRIMRDSYHPESNPHGVVNIGVAENTLMLEEMCKYFEKNFQLTSTDFTYGDGVTGTRRLSGALSTFLNSQFKPHSPVSPDHLVLGSGLLTLISQVARIIANPGEGILLASPYYQGFDAALMILNGVIPVGVSVPPSEMTTLAEISHLERGLQESNAKGTIIKAVILCNPHNPLGRCYPPDVILAYCQFCEAHNLHLLSDEIFALSVFPSDDVSQPEPFVSALSFDLRALGINSSRVHVLYGMSKDFNANGFRAAVLISQSNPVLIRSLTVTAMFMTVSSPADALWSNLLTDESYLPIFLRKNQLKLREAYEYMTSWLKLHDLPYIPSSAGHFLMVDMRPVLSDVTQYGRVLTITPTQTMRERELALSAYLLEHKVAVIPGAACHFVEGGWFRLSFSIRRDFVDIAFARIGKALGWNQRRGVSVATERPLVPTAYLPSTGDSDTDEAVDHVGKPA